MRKDGGIRKEEIEELLLRYEIGKKPLAKLLGWGETTILRYIEGDHPSREYADRLCRLYHNPDEFERLLLDNQDKISGVAYQKSMKAVRKLVHNREVQKTADFIQLSSSSPISQNLMQYYLYYAQGFSLALYGIPLFEEEFLVQEAFQPYPGIFIHLRQVRTGWEEMSGISLQQQLLLQKIAEEFSWYGIRLYESMYAIERRELKISRDKQNRKIIKKENLRRYFESALKQYGIQHADMVGQYLYHSFARQHPAFDI